MASYIEPTLELWGMEITYRGLGTTLPSLLTIIRAGAIGLRGADFGPLEPSFGKPASITFWLGVLLAGM